MSGPTAADLQAIRDKLSAEDLETLRAILFGHLQGCTDGYCIVKGRAKGMHTNGGCRCLQGASRAQLGILQSRLGAFLHT